MAKSKCTPENIALIIEQVKKGRTLKHSARRCGISYSTAKNWLKWGHQRGARYERYLDFLTQYNVAKADYLGSIEERAAKAAVTTKDCLAILALRDPWGWGWARIQGAIEKCIEKMADEILTKRSGGVPKETSSASSESP